MSAAATDLSELLSHELVCTAPAFEELGVEEAAALLVQRLRELTAYGWDWATAALLAVDVELPVSEAGALAPGVPAPLVLQ